MEAEIDYTSLSDEELKAKEKEYKSKYILYNTLQQSQKILLNSLYGATGAPGFRYFNVNLSSSITTTGQLAIRWIHRKLNELVTKETGIEKDRVVLVDTDSVVLNLEDLVNVKCDPNQSREEKLQFLVNYGETVIDPYIDESFKELAQYCNHYKQKLHMKRENIVNIMINVAKKAYVMEVYDSEGVRYSLDDPKLKIMGIQAIKSSVCKIVRDAILGRGLHIILHGTEEEAQKFVSDFKKEYYSAPVEQIAFPRSVSGVDQFKKDVWKDKLLNTIDLSEKEVIMDKLNFASNLYIKGTPINSKAAIVYNHLLSLHGLDSKRNKIMNGDKLKYVYLKTPNPIGEEVVGFQEDLPKEFELEKYIDYDTMFDKSFKSIWEDMIKPLGWELEKQNNLMDLFS